MTDTSGAFLSPNLPGGEDIDVKPVKTDNPLNGISTFDLVAISKHVLNVQPFTQPWQFIAADINKNNQVTTFDIVELRKMILGIYSDFPANTSWRFVPKNWVFVDPTNPFLPIFPEKTILDSAQIAQNAIDFLAIKTGDLTGDALTNAAPGSALDRSGLPPFIFKTNEKSFSTGEIFESKIIFGGPETPGGFQMTLDFDPKFLEIKALEPGAGMADFNFNLEKMAAGKIAVSWDGAVKSPGFSLIFNALRDGKISQAMRFGDEITRREAFFDSGTMADPQLQFLGEDRDVTGSGSDLILFQNKPNPFSESTEIAFFNPENAPVTLKISDGRGRVLFQKTAPFERGFQVFSLKKSDLGAADGVIWYAIQTPTAQAVRRMVVVGE